MVGAIVSYGVLAITGVLLVLNLLPPGTVTAQLLLALLAVTLVLAFLAVVLVYHLGWWSVVATRGDLLDALEEQDEEAEDRHPHPLPRGTLSAHEVVAAADRADGNRPDSP
jgi:cytochrome b subunit of formate dehydrogenase